MGLFGFTIGPQSQEEAERLEQYKEQRKAQDRYLAAKKRYDRASGIYRGAVMNGNTQDALLWKSEMEKALIDMNLSGFKGL